MKILQIIPTLGSGGAERFTVDLCNELVEQGNEVVLCTLYSLNAKKEYSFFKKEVKSDVKLINCNKKLGFDFTLFFKLFKLIKKEQPQVVHSHLSVLNYMLLAVFLIKNRYIHTLHSDAFKLIKNKGEYWLRKIVYSGKWVQPICISEESLESYTKLYKDAKAKIIYNGRKFKKKKYFSGDRLRLKTEEVDTIFLHVGRYDQAKNQLNLVKAFQNVLKKYPKILLLMIGDGDSDIKKKLSSYQNDNILLLGKKNNVEDYMEIADAFLLPSIFEGMPISLIEAMAHGLIPIVTRVGGMKNMVKNMENGISICGHDIENIEKGLIEFLNLNIETKEIMKNKIKNDFHKKYSIEKCVKQYIEVYGS